MKNLIIENYREKAKGSPSLSIIFIILMVLSGCARSLPAEKFSPVEVPEKQVKELIKKAQNQLDSLDKECFPKRDKCSAVQLETIHALDTLESTIYETKIDTESLEMEDFLSTLNYIRNEVSNLADYANNTIEAINKIEELKDHFQELNSYIDEIYLMAEERKERESVKISFKSRLTAFIVKKRMKKFTMETFGL